MALAFFESRGLATRVSTDGAAVWVDLIDPTTQAVAAEHYARGRTEEEAVARAVERYRVEQADWDQSGIRISLEFVPTITTSRALRERVGGAFAREGIETQQYERPASQLDAEREHPEWRWSDPSLRVRLQSELPATEIMRRVATPIGLALANVRREIAGLPFGITIEGQSVSLAFKFDDPADEMLKAMESLPTDLAARRLLAWDRVRGCWFDL